MHLLRTLALLVAAVPALLLSSACVYDNSDASELAETRRMVPPDVQAEVDRVLGAFARARPRFIGLKVSPPVADAFNSDVTPGVQGTPALGGAVRIADRSEPKRLMYFLDNSAITSEINKYLYNGLVHEDPVTLELRPDLAEAWETEDVVWLKGHVDGSVFEARQERPSPPDVDNAYVIGKLDVASVVWQDEAAGLVQQLSVNVGGEDRVYTADQLRLVSNADGSYKRMFDRQVVYTFHLRRGVPFHDGELFSARDFMFTLDIIHNPKIPEMTSVRAGFSTLKHWEALDDYTVRAYFDEQYYDALRSFADDFTIFAEHVFVPKGQKFTVDEMAKHFVDAGGVDAPIGTGPYAFPSPNVLPRYNPRGEKSGWQPSNYVKLYRTGDFWDPARRGYLDEISWYFYSGGAENILRAMNNREIDFTTHFGSDEIFRKTTPAGSPSFNQTYVKFMFFQPSYNFVVFNMRKPYFDDVRVRKAFDLLFDRDLMNNNLSYGTAVTVSGPDFVFGPAYDQSIPVTKKDRREAERLLNEAGWVDTDGDGIRDRDGLPFEIQFLLSTGKSAGETVSYIMKEELEALGIRLELRRLEWQSFLEHIDERKFDMYFLAYITDIESDPFGEWHSSQWLDRGQNTGGYNSPEADALILKLRRELDFERRMELHHQLHQLLARDVPKMFTFVYPKRGAYDRRLRNVQFSGRRPNFFSWQWYIPAELQTEQERALAKERWGDTPAQPLPAPVTEEAAAATPPPPSP